MSGSWAVFSNGNTATDYLRRGPPYQSSPQEPPCDDGENDGAAPNHLDNQRERRARIEELPVALVGGRL